MAEVSFGEWLKRQRKALGLTQEQLANQISCSTIALRKIEAEERRPSAQIVERMASIFDIPTSERTAFLHFARGDWKSAPGRAIENAPWRASAKSPRSTLPASPTSLIGRQKEIADIREYLSKNEIRLVTLIGPPGIGKTRLSIEVARAALPHFPDGAFFVALAPLNDPALIAVTVAQALGYVGARNMSTNEQLKEGIGDKQMLIVQDNCEHIIEEVASLASGLLLACPRLKILTTSRESLRIPGEWLYAVPAFDLPADSSSLDVENASKYPALTLFAERARAVRSDFSLNADNFKTIAEICAHLDGLPLVIELIAARMRLMSPQALLDRLSGQFVLTADGMRAASERQKTLHNAIDWSYNLLSPEEQKLFTYLSVFSGGFTLEAAEAIFSRTVTNVTISNLIASLLDKSLLQRVPDREARGEPYYTMLVTIQEFARDRLRGIGGEAEIRNAHLAYFLDLAEQGGPEMRGPNQVEWLNRLNAMHDNLRAALDWAIETRQTETALQMARKLHWFWFVHSEYNEARRSLRRVLALPDASQYAGSYAEALTQLAHHTWTQLGPMEAKPLVEEALSIARTRADKQNTARALAIFGLVLIAERDFAQATSYLEESMTLFREVHNEWEYAHSVIALALGAYRQDDLATSLDLHEQALALFRQVGDRYFQCVAQYFIGELKVRLGEIKHGMMTLREALNLARQLDSKGAIASVLWHMAKAEQYAGNAARSVQLNLAAKNAHVAIGAWQPVDDLLLENILMHCRAALSESAFAAAVEQGRAMTMEQAVAFALENQNA